MGRRTPARGDLPLAQRHGFLILPGLPQDIALAHQAVSQHTRWYSAKSGLSGADTQRLQPGLCLLVSAESLAVLPRGFKIP